MLYWNGRLFLTCKEEEAMRMRKILGLGLMAIFAIALVLSVSPPVMAGEPMMKATCLTETESAAPTAGAFDVPMATMHDTATDLGALNDNFYILKEDSGALMPEKELVATSAHRASGQYRGDLSASVTLNHTRAYRV